ncbi:hypothetical protein ACQPYK_19045 [Streptosporangium sp. CA-135522]|uniref:hypothetical protein n=1 Tax=Streptosporangium sp. CA-135522 TaxID=3240072 RepID=UPI003D8B1E34
MSVQLRTTDVLRPGGRRRARLGGATFAAVLAVLAPGGLAAAQDRPPASPGTELVKLTCTVTTTPGQPVTFAPPITFAPRSVNARGILLLESCTSPDGSHPDLRSGQIMVSTSGRASCGAVSNLRGQGTITWYDADGATAGTSEVRSRSRALSTAGLADALLAGTVISGTLDGRRVAGTVVPTTDTSCDFGDLEAVEGSGTLSFS